MRTRGTGRPPLKSDPEPDDEEEEGVAPGRASPGGGAISAISSRLSEKVVEVRIAAG